MPAFAGMTTEIRLDLITLASAAKTWICGANPVRVRFGFGLREHRRHQVLRGPAFIARYRNSAHVRAVVDLASQWNRASRAVFRLAKVRPRDCADNIFFSGLRMSE